MDRCEKVRRSGPFIKPETPTLTHAGEEAIAREMRHLLMERTLGRDFANALESAIDTPKQAAYTMHYKYYGAG
jgi:hypothetical protein